MIQIAVEHKLLFIEHKIQTTRRKKVQTQPVEKKFKHNP